MEVQSRISRFPWNSNSTRRLATGYLRVLAVAAGRGWDQGNNDEVRLMTSFIVAPAPVLATTATALRASRSNVWPSGRKDLGSAGSTWVFVIAYAGA